MFFDQPGQQTIGAPMRFDFPPVNVEESVGHGWQNLFPQFGSVVECPDQHHRMPALVKAQSQFERHPFLPPNRMGHPTVPDQDSHVTAVWTVVFRAFSTRDSSTRRAASWKIRPGR